MMTTTGLALAMATMKFFARCTAGDYTYDVYSDPAADVSKDFVASVVAQKGDLGPTFIQGSVQHSGSSAYNVGIDPFWGVAGTDGAHCTGRLSRDPGDIEILDMCTYMIMQSVDITHTTLAAAIASGQALPLKMQVRCVLSGRGSGTLGTPCATIEPTQTVIPYNPGDKSCAVQ
jgi:hypothetical protein